MSRIVIVIRINIPSSQTCSSYDEIILSQNTCNPICTFGSFIGLAIIVAHLSISECYTSGVCKQNKSPYFDYLSENGGELFIFLP
jgi:hypothetical protein